MNKRVFITLLGGAATAPSLLWPLAARAQKPVVRVTGFLGTESVLRERVGDRYAGKPSVRLRGATLPDPYRRLWWDSKNDQQDS